MIYNQRENILKKMDPEIAQMLELLDKNFKTYQEFKATRHSR